MKPFNNIIQDADIDFFILRNEKVFKTIIQEMLDVFFRSIKMEVKAAGTIGYTPEYIKECEDIADLEEEEEQYRMLFDAILDVYYKAIKPVIQKQQTVIIENL
jgi:hypothetical protein